jgi:hypothetical protein
MSQLEMRDSLLAKVIDVVEGDLCLKLAYENKDFDPTGLDAWCSFHFVPATSESTGKSQPSSDEEFGFVQVSVYVKKGTFDNLHYEVIDALKKVFYFGVTIDDVNILDVTSNNGYPLDVWYKRDLSINYSSFQGRG